MQQRTILLTGASTGIGRATAIHLARQGAHVWAGVRSTADAEALKAENVMGLEPISLDVTNETEVAAIAARANALPEGLSAVINNAGLNYISAFEFADEPTLRSMWEVNYFGLVRLSQRLLPAMRRYAAAGPDTAKLINISSVGGTFGLPWEVQYHGSKFAVVGLTEGLRHELWAQRIRAVVVLPGGIRTEFMPKTDQSISRALAALPTDQHSIYAPGRERLRGMIGMAARFGSPPESVARVLQRIVSARSPGFRFVEAKAADLAHRIDQLRSMQQYLLRKAAWIRAGERGVPPELLEGLSGTKRTRPHVHRRSRAA